MVGKTTSGHRAGPIRQLQIERFEERRLLSTEQTFDGFGTPFETFTNGNGPGAAEIADGQSGKGLRLVHATNAIPNVNVLSFPRTDAGAVDQIIADFDFRLTPGEVVGQTGRADGFSFVLQPTSIASAEATNQFGDSEEPNFPGALGIGFDLFQNDGDIGNNFIRPNYSNSVSVHFNGALVTGGQFDATPIVDLANGEWIHARIVMRPGAGLSDVSVILTPPNSSPTTLIDRFSVPGFKPYESRVYFGARSGGESAHHDLDNVKVDFANFPNLRAGLLEFDSAEVVSTEAGAEAVLTVKRIGGSKGSISVAYATAAITATSGIDFEATSGILLFAAGDVAPKTIRVPITDDSQLEGPERFSMTLSNPAGGAVLGTGVANVTILDNEGTIQDFDLPGQPNRYAVGRHVPLPTNEVTILPGGPTDIGNYVRLASEITDGNANHNSITFDSTVDSASNVTIIDFDFRIMPRLGRGDGMGFAYLNTASYGTTGPVAPTSPLFAAEEPDFADSLGIGFDTFNNNKCPQCPAHADDDINELAIHNIVSVHFDGVLIRQVDATPVVDLANGQWLHARITLEKSPNRTFSTVTVELTPCNGGQSVVVVDHVEIPGMLPYVGRARFAARSGGASGNHDLDNVNIQYLSAPKSLIAFNSNLYTVAEAGSAVVTVNRTGDTSGTASVRYSSRDASAMAGVDYETSVGALVFGPEETSKSFSVPILDNGIQEGARAFQILLHDASANAVLAGPFLSTVAINDDETAAIEGRWSEVVCTSVAAVHAHLLPNGNILYWDRLGAIRNLDPMTQAITSPANPGVNLFCAGHSLLANGDLLVTGGHEHGGSPEHDGEGLDVATTYDYTTDTWDTSLPLMNSGRWYPTNTTLGSGDVLVLSGSSAIINEAYIQNALPQIWQPASGSWRDLVGAEADQRAAPAGNKPLGVDLYPRMFLLPDGRVFKAGPDKQTWFLDTTGDGRWTAGPPSNFGLRTYGAAVMYEPGKILIVGGGQISAEDPTKHATNVAEVIDLNVPNPQWRVVSPMAFPRRQLNATVLPDGKVLVTGGTEGPEFNNELKAVLAAELWDPKTESWTTLPSMQVIRGYHSVAFLLPDGRVFSAGGGQGANAMSFENNAEYYSPAYLFHGARPAITSAPVHATYAESFQVDTPDVQRIAQVALIRLPSVTHSFDQNQRYVPLAFTKSADAIIVDAPASGNLAPPGHYMMFIVDEDGIPSVASIIHVGPANQQPDSVQLDSTDVIELRAGEVVGQIYVQDPDAADRHTFMASDSRFEILNNQLKLKAGRSLNHLVEPNVLIVITATDKGFPPLSIQREFQIDVRENRTPWRNFPDPFDVDNNNSRTPFDVLLILTELRRNGARVLPRPDQDPARYLDASGDNFISPFDVALCLSALVRGSGEGERRSTPASTEPVANSKVDTSLPALLVDIREWLFADLAFVDELLNRENPRFGKRRPTL